MKDFRPLFIAGAWALAATFGSSGVTFAQSSAGDRGLFRSARPATGPQELNVNVLVAEAHDDDALSEVRPTLTPDTRQAPGYHTTLLTSADYRRVGRNDFGLRGTAEATLRYYNDLKEVRSVSHHAAFGLSAPLPARMRLDVTQTAAYSPSYLYGLFPGTATGDVDGGPAVAPDYTVGDSSSINYRTSSGLSREVGREGRISGTASFTYTDYRRETALRHDVEALSLSSQFRQAVSRNAGVNLRYAYRTGDYGSAGAGTTTEHSADVGLDFSRRLSTNRSLGVAFTIGGSAMDIPAVATAPVSGSKYEVQADATLQFQFARDWGTSASYRRGLEYMPALTQPVFVDGANASIAGLVTRRIRLEISGAYASGDSILSRGSSRFDTYTGTARLQVAASRKLAFFGEYLYYVYDFSGNPLLAPGIPAILERNGVRGGVQLWIPAIGR
jgi:hypothetical protein